MLGLMYSTLLDTLFKLMLMMLQENNTNMSCLYSNYCVLQRLMNMKPESDTCLSILRQILRADVPLLETRI